MRLYKDIAQQYKIPAILVGRLAKEAENDPQMVEAHKSRKLLDHRKKEIIQMTATSMLQNNKSIVRLGQIQTAVQEQSDLEVSKRLISIVLRKDMGMGYRLAKTVPLQSNLERCLVL